MTIPQPPSGQGPVDPRGAFAPPPAPGNANMPPGAGMPPPAQPGQGMAPPPGAGMPGGGMPPPGFFPPPMMMMPPPGYYPPPRPSIWRLFARFIVTSIFSLSIVLNLYFLLTAAGSSSDGIQKQVIVSGDSSQRVAVVAIEGVITSNTADRLDRVIKTIEKDSTVKALVVEINTPGGEVSPSDEIYHRLITFKENKHLPVVVYQKALATSGGYYISCAGDQIISGRTTITANIGVIMDRYDLSKLADKWGVEEHAIYPQAAPYKPLGSMMRPMNEMEQAYWLGIVDDAYTTFKDVVKTGRAGKLKSPMETVANGRAYTANEALKMGLIDQIGYAADAYDAAARLAGLTNGEVVRYENATSLFDVLTSARSQVPSHSRLGVDGLNVNIDSSLIHDLTTPRLMYLWRGE